MTVSDYLLTRLKQIGVEHVFTVPGDYAGPFMAQLDATEGIARIATINELGAGYSADGYGRMKGVGAACVQFGVGTFSLLNCTAGSFVERVPVVVISASPKTSDRLLERDKGILFHHCTGDLTADRTVFRNVAVASEILDSVDTAPGVIDRAIVAMLTYRRPIYLEGLNDIWKATCEAPAGALSAAVSSSNPESLASLVEAVWDRIQTANLPVLWAGIEIHRWGLQSTLQALVDASGLFFTTTSLAKTVLDESQVQFIGTYAGPASPAITRAVMAATDCAIALGAIITDDYLDIMKSSFTKVIEVTNDRARVGHRYYSGVTLKDFLEALLVKFESPRQYEPPPFVPDPQEDAKPADGLTYNIFYDELGAFLKNEKLLGESVLVLGESTSLYVFGNLFGMPRDSFVSQAAWGSLGHETGCALGVALGSGKRPFVVAGDGGFMMICQEISSLVRQNINAVVFVMSNTVYAIEQAFVDIDAFKDGNFAPFDVLPQWNYLALAEAFGAKGYRAKTVSELRDVLAQVKGLQGVPALVEIVIPEKDLAPQLARLAATPQTHGVHLKRAT